MTKSAENLTQSLKSEAKRLGFDLCGACAAVQPDGIEHFENWIEAGYAGEMSYLKDRRAAYRDPGSVLDGAVSILMLGLNYQTSAPEETSVGQGRLSRYCWSDTDYHDLIHSKLKALVRFCNSKFSHPINVRGVVDTAPLLEREFAQLSGLGWQAKNTMLINREIGSWFFLAALLLDQPLDYDRPFESSHCGTCTACLDSCPTDAFAKPGVLDARKCISYLTIELKSQIPIDLRPQIADWVFGCDVCQDVCPWNNKAIPTDSSVFQPRANSNPIELRELFFLNDDQFRETYRKTPLWRPKRRGILRNAAIVLGNRPNAGNIEALSTGLNDNEELVRGASAWALGQHSAKLAKPLLLKRELRESIDDVKTEIKLALQVIGQRE